MKFLLLSFLFMPFTSIAQSDSIITYMDVVKVDSVSQADLFVRARQWYNETFKSAKDVLQINDKETGELSGKGYLTVVVKYRYMGQRSYLSTCRTSISVWVKDGRYKYSFSNLQVTVGPNDAMPLDILTSSKTCPNKEPMVSHSKMDEIWQGAKDAAKIRIDEIIESLNSKMRKKADNDF